MKLWALAIIVGLFSSSVAKGDESKDASLKAWGTFTGKWKVTIDDDETVVATIRRSEDGSCFIHENRVLTHVVGWDAERKMLRGALFFADGGHGVSLWKLTGDGPKFEGEVTVIDAEGDRIETTCAITFSGPDSWKGVIEKVVLFKAQRIAK